MSLRDEFESILRNRTYDNHVEGDEELFGELLDELAEAVEKRLRPQPRPRQPFPSCTEPECPIIPPHGQHVSRASGPPF